METRIIIAGGRDFDKYNLLKTETDKIIKNIVNPVIVSGGAKGADTLGERYAAENQIELIRFPADWKKYGKKAGYIRNSEMADYLLKADYNILIAFWNGESRGTKDMIEKATALGIETHIVKYESKETIKNKPRKGIFWLVEKEIWAFPFDGNHFSSGVSKSGDTYVHKKIWKKIKPKNCNHPYNYYPRGRVEITSKGTVIIYMNPNIAIEYIPVIMSKFGLTIFPKIVYDNSNHYKSRFDKGWKADKS